MRWLGGVLIALCLTACSADTSGAADAIRDSAQGYSDAFLTGDVDAAYDLLSERCQERLPKAALGEMLNSAEQSYGSPLKFKTFDAEVNGDQARVTYTYADAPELNQSDEPWVREGGKWREDDC